DSQNCCGSASPRPTGTHAARPARLLWAIQDRSSTVLPLPGGPDTTVTRVGAASRPNSLGRETTLPAPGPATPQATGSDPMADTMFPIIDRDAVCGPGASWAAAVAWATCEPDLIGQCVVATWRAAVCSVLVRCDRATTTTAAMKRIGRARTRRLLVLG